MDQSGDMFPKIELLEPEPESRTEPDPYPTRCRCDVEVYDDGDDGDGTLKAYKVRINGVDVLVNGPLEIRGLGNGPATVTLTVFATSLTVHRIEPTRPPAVAWDDYPEP